MQDMDRPPRAPTVRSPHSPKDKNIDIHTLKNRKVRDGIENDLMPSELKRSFKSFNHYINRDL